MTGAQRFGAILDAEMTRRGMANPELDRLMGSTPGRAWNWRNGYHLPLIEHARQAADLLDNEQLFRSVMLTRTKACAIEDCGATFVDLSRRANGLYCGSRCRKAADARRRRNNKGDRTRLLGIRVQAYKRAIAAFCKACEPEGTCRDAKCELQAAGVSPLRLSRRAVA